MWGLENGISRMPAKIIDGGGSVVATVGTGRQKRVTLSDPKENETFFVDGQSAIIEGTEGGFDLYQLNGKGERHAIQHVGPGERIKAVKLANGFEAEGITLV